MKVFLTPSQRIVFDRVVELTDNGKRSHTGAIHIAGIPGSTIRHTVTQCAILGLLKTEAVGRDRRLTLLIGPEGVETVASDKIMSQRLSGRALKADKLPARDTGSFSEAFEAAFGKHGYPSLKMKPDVPFKGTFKADARAL